MFNSNAQDDNAAIREIIRAAVSSSRAPGQTSTGNASGAWNSATSLLIPLGDEGGPVGGTAGVDEQGHRFFPFLLDVDRVDDEEARLS